MQKNKKKWSDEVLGASLNQISQEKLYLAIQIAEVLTYESDRLKDFPKGILEQKASTTSNLWGRFRITMISELVTAIVLSVAFILLGTALGKNLPLEMWIEKNTGIIAIGAVSVAAIAFISAHVTRLVNETKQASKETKLNYYFLLDQTKSFKKQHSASIDNVRKQSE